MTDAELIRRAKENDSEAWNALSQRYLPVVWRYAYALLQDVHATEDVVSEAMLGLLKNIDQIDTETLRASSRTSREVSSGQESLEDPAVLGREIKISAWLRAVVRHKVADHHRRVYRIKDHMPRVGIEHQRRDGPVDPSSPLVLAEKQTQITEILEELPERQRLALEWKYVEDLRVREIAQRLGETEKAVEATLYRARREFRRLYELAEIQQAPLPR